MLVGRYRKIKICKERDEVWQAGQAGMLARATEHLQALLAHFPPKGQCPGKRLQKGVAAKAVPTRRSARETHAYLGGVPARTEWVACAYVAQLETWRANLVVDRSLQIPGRLIDDCHLLN